MILGSLLPNRLLQASLITRQHLARAATAIATTALLLTGCGSDGPGSGSLTPSERTNQLFDALYMEQLRNSPMALTSLGMKERYDEWDDIRDEAAERQQGLILQQLNKLKTLDTSDLDDQTLLSLELFKANLKEDIEAHQWRHHDYPVNQMFGLHTQVPSLLINQHRIDSVEDAEAYISRLGRTQTLFDQLNTQLRTRKSKGIMPPSFVLEKVVAASLNVITGAPFDDGPDSPLLADFRSKVNALDIDSATKEKLIDEAINTLKEVTFRAYSKLIAFTSALQRSTDDRAGVWKLPRGDEYYAYLLRHYTTTNLTAEEIHQIGLNEVKRIHTEMNAIREQLGFEGDLQAFFEFVRNDDNQTLPNTEEGRAQLLKLNEDFITNMKTRLPELFGLLPKADLVVKAVEPFREMSAGKAFYQPPALDGSRPGIYYTNLHEMGDQPVYQQEALAYHEGIPGHHMQLAIAQELENMPLVRKLSHSTAYIEGWGLYSELLPKEIGLYQDPYSDFGRLSMELMRAIRLVVDTGIHHKKWTREQAIDYFAKNSASPIGDITQQIERYIVMPGQATAYKIGMLKILELRKKAKEQLGEAFDIREFHDVILGNGPLPLNMLEQQVDAWLADKAS